MSNDLSVYSRPTLGERPWPAASAAELPLEISLGYQVRTTHRLLQRYLQTLIEPHGVTLGMWYFLRVLWEEDGLTQRELSRLVGTMEPTTLSAIAAMDTLGIVRRERSTVDRRRQHVFLTERGRQLGAELRPLAVEVVRNASEGLSVREIGLLLDLLCAVQTNISRRLARALDSDTSLSEAVSDTLSKSRRRVRRGD